MNDPPTGAVSAPAESHAEIEARLLAKYGRDYARGLSAAEHKRQVALLCAPPIKPIPVIGKHVTDMTDTEYKAGLKQLGIYRR